MTLVTPQMMRAVRDIGEQGLNTEVSILTRSILEGTGGDEDVEVWATTATVMAWVKEDDRGSPTIHIGDHTGVIGVIGRYRIHLPWDAVVQEGDMIGLDGEVFMVNTVNNANTLRVFTTVIARKRD